MKSENLNKVLIVVLVLGVLAFGTYIVSESGMLAKETIDVSGRSTISVDPDEVVIRMGVETRADTAKDAQEQNAEAMSRVQNALKMAGLSEDDYETINYNLREEYDWSRDRREIIGYVASHEIKITTKNIDWMGIYIDVAADSGANQMYGINFQLSKELESEQRKEALKLATQNAQERAGEMAAGLGRSLGKAVKISDTSVNFQPYYFGLAMEDVKTAATAEAIQTQIVSGDVEVTASVSATYEIN